MVFFFSWLYFCNVNLLLFVLEQIFHQMFNYDICFNGISINMRIEKKKKPYTKKSLSIVIDNLLFSIIVLFVRNSLADLRAQQPLSSSVTWYAAMSTQNVGYRHRDVQVLCCGEMVHLYHPVDFCLQ